MSVLRFPTPGSDHPGQELLMMNQQTIAKRLNVSIRTLERWRSTGDFPKPDVVKGQIMLWKTSTVMKWIDGNTGGGDHE